MTLQIDVDRKEALAVVSPGGRDAAAENDTPGGVDSIVGVSPWAQRIRAEILQIAPHGSNVLITGPSGTGKELIAQAIHYHSGRADKPFVAVDCAAVSGPLFVSNMFGHVKGAFTGASNSALGCFRVANHGAIFLDEIGDLDPEFQAKLLRVLQQRAITPVGGDEEISIDVRVIAATNCDLAQMVSTGRFREDLYYRLNVIALKTVPLKDRREDVEALVRHILARLAAHNGVPLKQLSSHCLQCIRSWDWPGNVRELENYFERVTVLGGNDCAHLELLAAPSASDSSFAQDLKRDDCLRHDGTASLPDVLTAADDRLSARRLAHAGRRRACAHSPHAGADGLQPEHDGPPAAHLASATSSQGETTRAGRVSCPPRAPAQVTPAASSRGASRISQRQSAF